MNAVDMLLILGFVCMIYSIFIAANLRDNKKKDKTKDKLLK